MRFRAIIAEAYETQKDIHLELSLQQANGEEPLVEIKGRVRRNQNGAVLCYAAFRKE